MASAPIRAWKVAPSEGSWFIFLLCRLEERGAPHKPHLWNTWLLPLDVLYIYIYIRVLYYIRMPPYASMAPPRLARIHFRGLVGPQTCAKYVRILVEGRKVPFSFRHVRLCLRKWRIFRENRMDTDFVSVLVKILEYSWLWSLEMNHIWIPIAFIETGKFYEICFLILFLLEGHDYEMFEK